MLFNKIINDYLKLKQILFYKLIIFIIIICIKNTNSKVIYKKIILKYNNK